jgi:type IV pilus assembly protein PilB
MSDLNSIESLINPTDDDESVAGRFAKKQGEIKIKEIEKETEQAAQSLGMDYVSLVTFPISPEAIALIPEEQANDLGVVCFYYDGQNIRLGCVNPSDEVAEVMKHLSEKYFADIKLYLISETSLIRALETYKSVPKVKKYESGVEISEASLTKFKEAIANYKSLNEKINEVNISDVITLMLATAIKVGASDIHIEAEEIGVVIRIRIDGVLQEAAVIDRTKWKKIISRLKLLARVKLNIENKPQDGRYSIYLDGSKIDVRCSFLPTAFGESVVMRLLGNSGLTLSLESLGVRPEIFPILEREIAKPNGLILTTGPTGSGKTTTLYAILNKLNKPGVKIITLEDPIEYQLKGINQSQIDNNKKGYSFSDGLRSVLRQDPNVVMVGEIRDLETAEIAVQASLTGHIVLSTLHTNDAAGVIPRLIDLGVKPYFLVPSINAVIGQRLVRKLCPFCRVEHQLTEDENEQVNKILAVISPKAAINIPTPLPTLYRAGTGCEKCNFIGYKGRAGIYEIFTMDDKIKQLTIDQAPSFRILQQAIENGMITMLQDGVLKVIDGDTSLEEVYRVVGNFDYVNELYEIVISQTIGRGVRISPAEMAKTTAAGRDLDKAALTIKNTQTSNLVSAIMATAVTIEAGDIHIEPTESDVKVRFRIDGIMYDIVSLPKTSYLPLLSEIKILSGSATNVRRATYDGRFSLYLPNQKLNCRLSIIAGGYGETIVIRLLSTTASNLDISQLGITPTTLLPLESAMKKPRGIIITTGPTDSGKTTTLYSILNRLNKPDVKIITIEDPIEYQLPGVMQTQIDEERGYTFASAMRSLLRQNPNIMMIGEIRDAETAKIAMEASMAGRLVLSTMHTNSAASAISRLVGLGLERQALANAIEFTIGQRLVRRLCPNCREVADIDPADLKQVQEALAKITNPAVKIPDKLVFYRGVGCPACNKLGYKGRLGLYEGIPMTPEIQKIIQSEGVTDLNIEQTAIGEGMITMLQDGILKALNGDTSLEEIFRVI